MDDWYSDYIRTKILIQERGDKMNHKKLILKLFAGVVAIALIGGMLFITNSFVGNPISAMVASKSIQEYVNQNYSNLDLELGKTNFNFKDGSYMAFANSEVSIDTKFAIYYYGGRVQRDNYDSYVLGDRKSVV